MTRERWWIDLLAQRFGREGPGIEVGIGSDCAILATAPGKTVVSTDALVEGIHFDLRMMDLADAGFRAAATSLSDLAAAGVDPKRPILAFLSVALSDELREVELEGLADGFEQAFRAFGVRLAGGDTVSTFGPLTLCLTVIGYADRPMTRVGARGGHRVFVAGTLGGAGAGLALLKSGDAADHDRDLVDAYRRPKPLIAVGAALADLGASACADISDGLLADAGHIAEESGVAMELDLDALPLHPALAGHHGFSDDDRVRLAATHGDDYALVFTVPSEQEAEIESAAHLHGWPCVRIGVCTAGPPGKVMATLRRRPYEPEQRGYEHD
ncbi:MAG: thiamine-phosphate kinase [Deltaproteobacteria bacterium]|nr:thiamine-phosphate kinase [Deltaproteobacteria bacterium]